MTKLFDIAICTIFAREFLEGSIIIGQYRTVIQRSPEWKDEEKQKAGLREVTRSALLASAVAVLVCIAVAVPLAILSNDLDERVVEVIEGISKVIAAVCIIQLSLKIPKWLGLYASKKVDENGESVGLTLKSIRFNVAWNIWREVAECGVFLIPFFLTGDGATAIPISALIGIVVALVFGAAIYFGSRKLEKKFWLAFFLSAVTGMLSVGLFVGGCHEFEEVWGETKKVWKIKSSGWSHKKLPMAIFKPFGYSSSRTVLQIVCFWTWFSLLVGLHVWKYHSSKKIFEARALEAEEKAAKVTDTDVEAQDSE